MWVHADCLENSIPQGREAQGGGGEERRAGGADMPDATLGVGELGDGAAWWWWWR